MKTLVRRRVTMLVATGVLTLGLAATAVAADSVSQTVNGGSRTASAADLTLSAVNYSHSDQSSAGTMVLTVDDSSGTGQGWNVTIQAGQFAYTGANSGTAITADKFSLTSAATPVSTAGQAVDATNGPKVPTTSPVGTLDVARKVVQANAGYGQGTYTQNLGVSLTVPGQSRAGSYAGTLTTTITAGP